MNEELVSVLIPMYNSEKYIKECILSILKQTYKNIEVVVMNDGSVDKSEEIVNELAKMDSRIKLYKKENEKSVSLTRNSLLKKITGEYFIFVDSDDIVSPVYIERLMKSLKSTDSDIACCGFTVIKNKFTRSKKLKKHYTLTRKNALNEMVLGKDGHFMVWNKLTKTSLIKDIEFDRDLNYGEDFVYVFKLLQKEIKVSYISNKLYFYRLRKGSISSKGVTESKKRFLDRMIEMENNPVYLSDKPVLSSWIYITSALYLVLIKFKKEGKEYKQEFKNIMKTHYLDYKRNKHSIRLAYRFLMSFIKTFFRVKVEVK